MYCVRNVTSDLYWVGANDHRLALFENCFPIPRGVSYNAYCLLDEKTVLFDTVDWSACRQLLENVTLHPSMGLYLSHLANQKAFSYKNSQGVTVSGVPDENFAREVMQLFSIGLYQRNSDFSLKLDGSGKPIPTYDQAVIASMARVFTGWTWAGNPPDKFWQWGKDNEARPMECHPRYHDDQPKTIFNGIVITKMKLQPSGSRRSSAVSRPSRAPTTTSTARG